jgi:Domain of unknown function (DUF4148)
MKTSILAALLISATVAAPAFAGPATSYGRAPYAPNDMSWVGPSTASRAEVKAELVQARESGLIAQDANRIDYPVQMVASNAPTVTRAEVKTDLATAEANGQIINERTNN